uniref:Si:ch211-110p13.9 n=1 Tax=Amphiprion percula TaxID=161767 RepID=A0A3P8UBJ5_AMPPE
GPVIPLYLGADLLSNTDIRTENHPRYHARFAKKGLATKINFSSFRFNGLKVPAANNSLWFYSIQGLFRVAFEIYSKQEQLAVLENFQQSLQTEQSQPLVSSVRQKLHSLDDQLSSDPQSCTEQLETVLLLLENINQYIKGNLEEKDATETVLALLKAKDWGSVYSSSLLSCVGCWLGQQFHAANSSISQKVEGFKVQHIERISDLPPAEELATELFPEAMQTLLLHWMGLSEESSLEKRHSEYPILLLILEFANHNLITGVAHVLYSSLICK